MLKIFVGVDPRQPISLSVLMHSIIRRASVPISITPLVLKTLPITRRGLTEFTYSRFLVPWLCDYKGWGLFLDADMAVFDDVGNLLEYATPSAAVLCVDTEPAFERASVMLFNCAHPDNAVLTPEYIETAKDLHRMGWTENVWSLPPHWNHLVGYDEKREGVPSLIHYTMGVPAFPETADCDYADLWMGEHRSMNSIGKWSDIMGPSVHTAQDEQGNVVPKYKVA